MIYYHLKAKKLILSRQVLYDKAQFPAKVNQVEISENLGTRIPTSSPPMIVNIVTSGTHSTTSQGLTKLQLLDIKCMSMRQVIIHALHQYQ